MVVMSNDGTSLVALCSHRTFVSPLSHLYESHSLIHGRPFPLQGEYFANIFVSAETLHSTLPSLDIVLIHLFFSSLILQIHFRPTGKLLRERKEPVRTEDEDGLPIYILSDSPEEKNWLRSHPKKVRSRESPAAAPLSNLAHAAATGDIETITYYAKIDKAKLHEEDANGWQPIHEAARGGHQKVVELLIKHGADVNKRVNFGEGESILGLVIQNHGRDHPLVDYLYGLGALEVGPDL
jgi:prolyl 4-hydroxylase